MRKIVMFNLVTIDGYFAGEDGNIDWHVVDDEFNKAAVDMIQRFDTILFGRVTYRIFEDYWPDVANDPNTIPEDKVIATKINEMKKVVVSSTLTEVTWQNTKLIKGDLAEEIKKLKAEEGKDIVIYGSGTIVQQLANLDLIDEYDLMINPVILGKGKLMFKDVKQMKLKRISSREFASGNVLVCYESA